MKLRIVADVAAGMLQMHSRKPKIIHKDLKAHNILVRLLLLLLLLSCPVPRIGECNCFADSRGRLRRRVRTRIAWR
jgi:hypothetical protein